MSNRVEAFQKVNNQLAVPAARTSVSLDGRLCPYLEAVEIVRGGWPEFSWARLAYNPTVLEGDEPISIEDVENMLSMGKEVCIRQFYNGIAPGASAFSIPVFVGQIDGIETEFGPNGEAVEIISRDFSAALKRITVYGRRVRNIDGSSVFLAGVDTNFNEAGEANASVESTVYNGNSVTLFAAEPSKGKFWSCAETINYLLCEYLSEGQLLIPNIGQLEVLTGGQKVRDLDVTGLNIIEALHRCCERTGLNFKFIPCPMEMGPRQAIAFYKEGTGRIVELNCQRAGERLSISKTGICTFSGRKNFWPVTHKYIGQGDFKVYEATFDLVKAWDEGLEDNDYDKFSPVTNPDFYQVKDVYRKWCLNEAGDYTGQPYCRGEAFDFSKIFEGGNFAHSRRHFWPALSSDKQGKSLGYFLQVSFNDGQYWWQYRYGFNNLLDECGVWLSSDQLDVDTWVAAMKGVLKFRITASVVSDERLSCAIADGPVDSVAPVVEHLITLPRQFKYRKVSGQSIFANTSDEAIGVPNEIDDSVALFGFVWQRASTSSEIIATADIQTPYPVFDYQVGDRVCTSPESRDLLGCRRDNRSVSLIERVHIDFRKQCTNLKVVSKRIFPL